VKISNKKFSFFSIRNQNFPHIPYVASKIISITTMDVEFWGVKCSGSENSYATVVKCSNIRQKKLNLFAKVVKYKPKPH
jgi:hypothetical protein